MMLMEILKIQIILSPIQKALNYFGQKLGATASFSGLDSTFGDRDEIAVGLSYKYSLLDTSWAVWHDLDNEWYGVEIGASSTFETPISSLSVTPFCYC